jgi:hypothetical protein
VRLRLPVFHHSSNCIDLELARIPSARQEFLEAGKRRLSGDTKREATSSEVLELRDQNTQLKELVAELSLDNRRLKKISDAGGEGVDQG